MRPNLSNSFTLQKAGGLAAIGMALCYLTMAVIFFGVLSIPEQADTLQKIQYYRQHHLLVASGYAIGYLLFGFLLAVLVLAVAARLPQPLSPLAQLASLFGRIWVVLMMVSGMSALLGLEQMFRLAETQPAAALAFFHVLALLSSTFGGGIELVGGLWVLLLSMASLQQQPAQKALHLLGLLVGMLGVATILHTVPYLKEGFGLTQLVWLLWSGAMLLRRAQ